MSAPIKSVTPTKTIALTAATVAVLDGVIESCWDTYDAAVAVGLPASVLTLLRVALHELECTIDAGVRDSASQTADVDLDAAFGQQLTAAMLAHQVVRRWLS
ncbi:hypothetical protein QEN35_20910 [Gordonia alkanivorans]|uniref:hypothetical protein n=1 Tax=Gordonia alkanivorans TaxID=84096 RepID=UPI001F4E7BC6|nr:hypothetical protein [Gordonia alkanivorans]MDH3026820.1 hypothetical protein [Gordonia alkanivorans]